MLLSLFLVSNIQGSRLYIHGGVTVNNTFAGDVFEWF
jgi:hypothetical protein